jgi:N-acetyl-anhydromuramyl-L-alanine amidase AmpD
MPDGRVASWNYAVDRDSATQSVRLADTAFHGGKGANAHTAGVEVSMGYARQTPAEWDDDYSREAMELAAELFAILCREEDIPPVRPHHSRIRDESVSGIIGHVDLRDAGYPTSHYDPGPHFPWERWLGRVRFFYEALDPWFER